MDEYCVMGTCHQHLMVDSGGWVLCDGYDYMSSAPHGGLGVDGLLGTWVDEYCVRGTWHQHLMVDLGGYCVMGT